MPTNTANFPFLLAPGFRKFFFDAYKYVPEQYSQLANMKNSKRAYEEDAELIGLPAMTTKPEGTPIIFQNPSQGAKIRYTHIAFGAGFRITEEMYEDDLYGQMRKMPKQLGKGARIVREVRFFNLLNLGFTAVFGFPKNGVNETLFNTAHTLLGGGTLANRFNTDMDLGVASLEAAVLLFDNLVDELGYPMEINPKWLVHPPNLKQVVRELTGSEFRPDTNTNAINAVRQDGIQGKMVRYLTNTNSWFLLAEKDEHDLQFIERRPIRFYTGEDFDTGDAKYKATQRFSVGVGEWRGTFGSQGG